MNLGIQQSVGNEVAKNVLLYRKLNGKPAFQAFDLLFACLLSLLSLPRSTELGELAYLT